MYSVVLMMALSSGSEMPAFGRGCGCRGCSGCSGCSGCYGGRGCRGGYGGCHGGYGGCYGGGYGGCCSGGYGGYGGCYGGCGGYAGMAYSAGCSGCYGGSMVAPGMAPPAPAPAPKPSGEARLEAPATLVVNLPAGATLMIDDSPTSSNSTSRVFQTPPLQAGYDYYYTLKAEAMQDGKPVQVTNRVTVRAGEITSVRLEFPLASVARQ